MSDVCFMTGALAEPALQALAVQMAEHIRPPLVIFLEGDLGAGKTTFTRALVQALGHTGSVKSPTYGLMEHYELNSLRVLHLDLYRIGNSDELEFLGLVDLIDSNSILIVEWPENGRASLPPADIEIHFEHVEQNRQLTFYAHSSSGNDLCQCLKALL